MSSALCATMYEFYAIVLKCFIFISKYVSAIASANIDGCQCQPENQVSSIKFQQKTQNRQWPVN